MMEGCKDTFNFGAKMALFFFVYEGIGSKFCPWLPVNKHEEHCGIIFEGTSKSLAYLDYSVCVAVGIWRGSQLPIICSNYLQLPVACAVTPVTHKNFTLHCLLLAK